MEKIIVLSGAGMSAESGIKTFRDDNGLWNNHRIEDVATPEAWERNPKLVNEFYNQRRKELFSCKPNEGHKILSELEKYFDVQIITQNVDDLHERAGSTNVLHLHGELKKVRSTIDPSLVYELDKWELKLGDKCEKGSQLRPHIVWFGEAVPNFEVAASLMDTADIVVVVGTSLTVYPAAGLMNYAKPEVPIFIIDPGNPSFQPSPQITFINKGAGEGLNILKSKLLKNK